jgi:tetratricopeptide (TPR) repeat protein
MLTPQEEFIEKQLYLMSVGDYQTVHKSAIESIAQDLNNPLPYFFLAKLCYDHKNNQKSIELFEKSLSLDPSNAYTLVYFAQMQTQLGNNERARELAELAATNMPNRAHLFDTLGVVFSRAGNHEKAIAQFKKAVERDSNPANYHYNLAVSLQFLGDFDGAEHAYNETLARDPKAFKALSSLVSLRKQSEQNNKLALLKSTLSQLKHNVNAKLYLGHALAKTYEDLGDYPQSFKWLLKAKEDKRNIPCTLDYENICRAAMKTPDITSDSRLIDQNSQPIFIVGLPRTGTTLVDRIISSHNQAVSVGELNTFAEHTKKLSNTSSNLVLDAATLEKASSLDMKLVGEQYMRSTLPLRKNAKVFVDKMPLNFFYAGLILKALPRARVIVLRRNAMDSCLSNFRQLLTVEHAYYDYTYNLENTADFYIQFDKLMRFWRDHLPSDRFMEIKYEDIIANQEQQTKQLLSFCGLEWDDACLSFHENKAAVSTASSVQVRQPLYSSSIGRWKRYGSLVDGLKARLDKLI